MDRRLWDEPVRRRDAEKSSDEGGDAEEEEVPVKSGRFLEGEVGALGNERLEEKNIRYACVGDMGTAYGNVMIEIEEDKENESKWKRHADVSAV